MNRTLFTIFLTCMCSGGLFAQNPIFKRGMKLIYKVSPGFGTYDFAVKPIKTSSDIVFDWHMTHKPNMNGTVTMTKDAVENASSQMNMFESGEKTLTDMTTVLLSRSVFQSLKDGKATKMNTGSGEKTFFIRMGYDYKFILDGKEAEEHVVFIESEDKKEKLWVMDNEIPVILKMSIGFGIELKEVVTLHSAGDLNSLLGKSINAPEALPILNRIKGSCWIELQDLSGGGNPSVYKEYYCPIEGIGVKTHNDLITQFTLYREGAGHGEYHWKGTDLDLPLGIDLDMTRGELEKLIGKPDYEDNDDATSYYPKAGVLIYFEMEEDEDENAISSPDDHIWFITMEQD